MAIYIPGVQDFVPQLETFTPDYKFLSDVLETRQDRYTTNYDQLNDIYGKVVYSDLSRGDTQNKRDQYANQLSGRLQQITGMDLSLQQNVDAARGLFKPFYDDDLIVRDMVYTKQYKDQLQRAQQYQDSPIKEVREKYWDVGVKGLNYQMEDFINASSDEALKMSSPKYVPDADLPELAEAALKKSGISIEGTTFEGDWIVKQKNGSLVVKPARAYIEEMLLDDPIVKNAYFTKAYVEAREYGDQHAEEFGSVDKAKKKWAEDKLQQYHQKQKAALAKNNVEVKEETDAVANWEKYNDKYGVFQGSKEDKEWLKQMAALEILQTTQKKRVNRLALQAEPASDLTDLLNKAYSALAGEWIGTDLDRAAYNYSNIDASVEIEANPFKQLAHKNAYDMNMVTIKQRMQEYNDEIAFKRELFKQGKGAEYAEDLEKLKARLKGFKGLKFGKGKPILVGDIKGTEDPYLVDGELGVVDVFKTNDEDITQKNEVITGDKFQSIADIGSKLVGDSKIKYTHTTKKGEKIVKESSWPTAKKDLLKPENSSELNRLFLKSQKLVDQAEKKRPEWVKHPEYLQIKNRLESVNGQESLLAHTIDQMNKKYSSLEGEFIRTEHGEAWGRNYEKGMPSIFMSPAYERGVMQDKADHPLGGLIAEDWVREKNKKDPSKKLAESLEKTLVPKEQYIKNYVKWAQLGKTNNNPLTLNNSENPYWNFDASDTQKTKHLMFGTPLNKQQDNIRSVTGAGGGALPPDHTKDRYSHTWKFDEEKALEDAGKAYDKQKKAYNMFMDEGPGEGEGENRTYSIRKALTGEEQDGIGLRKHSGYKFIYDHAVQSPESVEQLEHIFSIIHGEERYIRTGNEAANMNMERSEKIAEVVMELLELDMGLTFGDDDDKAGAPRLSITYAESLGGKAAGGKYAGYIIQFTPEYAKKLKSTREDPGNNLMDLGSWKDNTLTLFVPKGLDRNPYNSFNTQPSVTEVQIIQNGEVTFNDFPGGGAKIFKNSNDQFMVQRWTWGYDSNPESAKFDEMVKEMQDPQVLNLESGEIDGYLTYIKKQAERQAGYNNKMQNEAKILYPDRLKKKRESSSANSSDSPPDYYQQFQLNQRNE